MTGFLTDHELEFYTGRKQGAAQIRLLQKRGIHHTVNANGRPRVTWEDVNGAKSGRREPNFAALRKAG